jgi:hypothetical protein
MNHPPYGYEQHPDPMMNACTAIGYARVEYNRLKDAMEGFCREMGFDTLKEIKDAFEKRFTVEHVSGLQTQIATLEQKVTKMSLEFNKQRGFIDLKDKELIRVRSDLSNTRMELEQLASICEVPGDVRMNSELYQAGILNLDVFKSEQFKKFNAVTQKYVRRVDESNKTVAVILDKVRERLFQTGAPPSPSPNPGATSAPGGTSTQTPTKPTSAPAPAATPGDKKGKGLAGESSAPPASSPAANTRSTSRNLMGTPEFQRTPSAQKLHDQQGVEHSDEDPLPSDTEYELTEGGKRRIAGRIGGGPPLKIPKEVRPQFGYSSRDAKRAVQ